jgi:hypothetical protein
MNLQIKLIDHKQKKHWTFSCRQWIDPNQDYFLLRTDRKNNQRKTPSTRTNSNRSSISFTRKKRNDQSKRVSLSSSQSLEKLDKSHWTSTNKQFSYRLTISSSKDNEETFHSSLDSRIYLRLNEDREEIFLTNRSFQSGQSQTFPIRLSIPMPKKFVFGYVNKHPFAKQWRIDQVCYRLIDQFDLICIYLI